MKPPVTGNHEFERWYEFNFMPYSSSLPQDIQRCHKETLLIGWNACKEKVTKEINSSVNFYTSASDYNDPMISKSSLLERLSKL